MSWPVLKCWLRKRTILVSIEIKICSKDELGQWDSMRARFSHSIWNKKTWLTRDKEGCDIVKLWKEMIISFSCFLGGENQFMAYGEKIKTLPFAYSQTEISDLDILNLHLKVLNNNKLFSQFLCYCQYYFQ